MGNMHLVTGYAGKEHVTAADHGSLYAALVSRNSHVFSKGMQLNINKISDNLVRVMDGDLIMQGRHCRVAEGAFVDLPVESGQNGYKRRDLVCARYFRDPDTGVEDCNLVVLRGNPVAASPTDPNHHLGNILGGATLCEFPLYRLNLNGTSIESIDKLFTVFENIEQSRATTAGEFALVWAQMAGINAGIPKIATGSYKGTGTYGGSAPTSITFPFAPKLVVVSERDDNSKSFVWAGQDDISGGASLYFTLSGNTLSWKNYDGAGGQLNHSSKTYVWLAIGL